MDDDSNPYNISFGEASLLFFHIHFEFKVYAYRNTSLVYQNVCGYYFPVRAVCPAYGTFFSQRGHNKSSTRLASIATRNKNNNNQMLPRQRKKSMVVTQESFEQFLGNPSFNLL
jgi:hypothetical protein